MTITINNKNKKPNVPNSTDKGNAIRNLPNLRFPEFSEEWKEHELSEYLDFKNGLNPKPNQFGKGIKFISVMDILNNAVITYDCIRASVSVSEEDMSAFSVQKGDILFQRSSETLEDVGRANVYVDDIPAVFGGFVIRGKQKTNYNPLFFKYLLSSPLARKRIIRMGAGAQHFNIGQEGLSKVKLPFACIDEQNKIAKILYLLDKRISLQSKIIEKMQTLIKGIAHKVSKQGKPNIRLSECLLCTSSTLQESDVAEVGAYPVYGANGIVGYLDTYNTTSEAIYIIKDGSGVGAVSCVKGKCSATGTLNILQTKEGFSLRYLYFILKVFSFEPYKTGMAIPHIYFKDYGKAKIYCPSNQLQCKYADLLSKIEQKATAEQKILDNLCSQKQYLLCQMFI